MAQSNIQAGELLQNIRFPEDLRKLPQDKLHQVSTELRQYIIDQVSLHGGHFGASLGVVELTVALHYVYNTPFDQLVWDVGHQAYGHKILTGRKEQFHTNRKYKGLSGFPKRSESEYDTFGVGHSSTSVSAAVGMAVASKYKAEKRNVVAVIGDGAMTAGLAFEGMNHAGVSDTDMLIVLNDNCMSIDPNVGALKEYLTDITASQTWNRMKDDVWHMLGKLSTFGKSAREIVAKVEQSLKSAMFSESNFFESLKLRYFGPIDGHDINHLVKILQDMKDIKGPKLLHVVTVKGKGFQPAEAGDPTLWHAPGVQFDKISGALHKKAPAAPEAPKYQDVFGHTLVELAEHNPLVMGVTPAMPTGCSMKFMIDQMPHRAFDVGIAEQHAVTFSAGLATQGMKPFCNIYSSFMQRAYDQVIHDVAIQELPVIFCLDRGGLAGADGPTHHGAYDLAYMRCIPNMIVSAPMNEQELRNLMYTAQLDSTSQPFSIRYPRGKGVMVDWRRPFAEIPIGKGRKVRDGEDVAILTIGHPGNFAVKAGQLLMENDLRPAHYDLRFVKPLDDELLHEVFGKFRKIVTVEDGCIQGGFGSAILEWMADHGYHAEVKRLGIPDQVIEHGEQSELWKECGFDAEAIAETVRQMTGVVVRVK